ncbi:hypothetical protein HAX54_012286 [Datura stramonium]|uniref:Uncharacterized protein n=1 Tax=Datura stramonium TaxID=4076 RepID=A0ABS8TLC8_DATST|nr:hypothetical protein [Datura stramonium]
MLLVMMKQMEMLTSYVKGFHAKNSHVVQDYDDGYYGNQGSNNVSNLSIPTSCGSTEVLPPHMESTLEVVLGKVGAVTEEGVQDHLSKLLDLTTMSGKWRKRLLKNLIVDVFLESARAPIPSKGNRTFQEEPVNRRANRKTGKRRSTADLGVQNYVSEQGNNRGSWKITSGHSHARHRLECEGRRFKSHLKPSTHCIGRNQSHHIQSSKKIEDKVNQFQWVARIIAQGQPQWVVSKGLIHRRDLKFDARMCLDLVYSRLMPSRNTSEVPIEVATLQGGIIEACAH